MVVEEGVAGDEAEVAQGAVEGAEGDEAAVAGVGFAGGAVLVELEGGVEPGVEVGWGVEEVDVVALGGGEEGFEVADELGGAAVEKGVVVEGGDEGVEVAVMEGAGDLLSEVIVGMGHDVDCM